jgi:hypothetical protein
LRQSFLPHVDLPNHVPPVVSMLAIKCGASQEMPRTMMTCSNDL